MKPGPTGKFPQGKIREDDEGELKIAVAVDNNKLIVHFGKPIVWFGFDKAQAQSFVDSLQRLINKLD